MTHQIHVIRSIVSLIGISSLVVAAEAGGEESFPPSRVQAASHPKTYSDGRAAATFRLAADDQGVVLRHGDGPGQCDRLGARDPWVYQAGGSYYLHYDAAGPKGWLCALATSPDLFHWTKKGTVLDFGRAHEEDSGSASYGTTYYDGRIWHMFYLGTPHTSPAPDLVPALPYLTLKAESISPAGPWVKQREVIPFRVKPGTYYSGEASPGQIVRQDGQYRMFFSAAAGNPLQRTLSIARTENLDGPWSIALHPLVPLTEQVENSSLYFEETNQIWFLFTNHIGVDKRGSEWTDAIWVYWTKNLDQWDRQHKAVVLDGSNCKWSSQCIGLPSVVKVGRRLAVLYDAPGGASVSHMNRDIGLAWLNLPLIAPADN